MFSFGIVLCEIIARVTADPDELPRLKVNPKSTADCPEMTHWGLM